MALTVTRLKEVLQYDSETGHFHYRRSTRCFAVGDRAGHNSDGYVRISIDGHDYYGHRLAWLYVFGEWPRSHLDHKNLKRGDNRIENLRRASRSQNIANTCARAVSGFKGVSAKRGRWRAQITANGETLHLGTFDAPEAAHLAYIAAAKTAFGEFARAA